MPLGDSRITRADRRSLGGCVSVIVFSQPPRGASLGLILNVSLTAVCHERANERTCDAVRKTRAGPLEASMRRATRSLQTCRFWRAQRRDVRNGQACAHRHDITNGRAASRPATSSGAARWQILAGSRRYRSVRSDCAR